MIFPVFGLDSTAQLLDPLPTGSATQGRRLALQKFENGRFFPNCYTCHAYEEPPYQARRFAGPPLKHSWYRQNFVRSQLQNPEDAIARCMSVYQGLGPIPSLKDKVKHLSAFLRSQSSPTVTAPWEYLPIPTTVPDGIFHYGQHNNTFFGQILFENSCVDCHKENSRLSLSPTNLSREKIYRILRGMKDPLQDDTSKAPYDLSRLSEDDLSAIISYIMQTSKDEPKWTAQPPRSQDPLLSE